MIEALLFDLDGLLIDSEPMKAKAYSQTFKEFGIMVTEEEFIENSTRKGAPVDYYLKKYNSSISAEVIQKGEAEAYLNLIKDIPLMPGAKEVLQKLKNKFRIALVTSSRKIFIDVILPQFGMEEDFEIIVSGADFKKSKPNPEIYFQTAKKLDIKPEKCLVIEDADKGLRAAKAAGMKCIIVPNDLTKDDDFSQADLVVKSLDDVQEEIINKL